MDISKKVSKAVKEQKDKFETSGFKLQKDFYEEMKKLGVTKKNEYNIPPIDTVGRRLYELSMVHEKEECYK